MKRATCFRAGGKVSFAFGKFNGVGWLILERGLTMAKVW